jgi:hypothetical protein
MPDIFTEPTPESRTDKIQEILGVFKYSDGNDNETAVMDLMADIMHFCYQKKIDYDISQDRAENHFLEELKEAGLTI